MAALYVPWLADAARSTGYPVVEVPGWRSRGHGGMRLVEGVVGHHTATSAAAPGDYPSLSVVTNGRSDLRGPLCNLGLGRNGTIYIIAAGIGYHAGASRWLDAQGRVVFVDLNDEFLGIEAESSGTGVWTDAQLDAYPKLVGALLRYMARGTDRYVGHKDICVPRGRKPDPVGIDTTWMRGRAAAFMTGGDEDMPLNEADMRGIWTKYPAVQDKINPANWSTPGEMLAWVKRDTFVMLQQIGTIIPTLLKAISDSDANDATAEDIAAKLVPMIGPQLEQILREALDKLPDVNLTPEQLAQFAEVSAEIFGERLLGQAG